MYPNATISIKCFVCFNPGISLHYKLQNNLIPPSPPLPPPHANCSTLARRRESTYPRLPMLPFSWEHPHHIISSLSSSLSLPQKRGNSSLFRELRTMNCALQNTLFHHYFLGRCLPSQKC
jgi:hypothetical protein